MKDFEVKFASLKRMQAQRLKVSFDTTEKQEAALQNQIFDVTREITCILKESEKNLKLLKNSESESIAEERVKDNILTILASRLRSAT